MNKIYADIIAHHDKYKMRKEQTSNADQIGSLPTIDDYKMGTFNITEEERLLVNEALLTAKNMRQIGDTDVEDATRAFILIRGAAYLNVLSDTVTGEDEKDLDRQVTAYMDGVAELMERFPVVLRNHLGAKTVSLN